MYTYINSKPMGNQLTVLGMTVDQFTVLGMMGIQLRVLGMMVDQFI